MKRYHIYPVCAHCSIIMDPAVYDDVIPGFVINDELYCPDCFKEWAKDAVDSDPEAVARAMDIEIRRSPYGTV